MPHHDPSNNFILHHYVRALSFDIDALVRTNGSATKFCFSCYVQTSEAPVRVTGMPEWAVPKAKKRVPPYKQREAAAAAKALAKARAHPKGKPSKKPAPKQHEAAVAAKAVGKARAHPKEKLSKKPATAKAKAKAQAKAGAKPRGTEYGAARVAFLKAYTGPKSEAQEAWRISEECQRLLSAMPMAELKRRRFDHLLLA